MVAKNLFDKPSIIGNSLESVHLLCLLQSNEEHLKKHYSDLKSKPFFGGLVKYMSSGPVVPMVS